MKDYINEIVDLYNFDAWITEEYYGLNIIIGGSITVDNIYNYYNLSLQIGK